MSIRRVCIGAAVLSIAVGVILTLRFAVANDGYGYLAAGERLLAGHGLYELRPGDRPVGVAPPFFTHPFLYPPAWGILWVPLAALPHELGLAIWMAVLAGATLGVVAVMLSRGSEMAAALLALLGLPIGLSIVSANVNALTLVAGALAWWRPASVWVGALIGVLAGVKLLPALLLLWLLGQRAYRAVATGAACALAVALIGLVAGTDETVRYIREVIPGVAPMSLSPAAILGVPALTYVLVAAAALATWALRRRPALSFAAAILGLTFASPAVGFASLALLAPIAATMPSPELSLAVSSVRPAQPDRA